MACDPLIRPLVGGPGRTIVNLSWAEDHGLAGLRRAPRTVRIVVENLLWQAGQESRTAADMDGALARAAGMIAEARSPTTSATGEFVPARVLLQDHSGIPVLAELASLRSLAAERGLDPAAVRLVTRADLVVDHSVEAHAASRPDALMVNLRREYSLNAERYRFLRWAQGAFGDLSVVPPGRGIVHQLHLEHFAQVVTGDRNGLVRPDTVIGTDSHTPMVNALGVLGWGVGGIEAAVVLLGDPIALSFSGVVGVRLHGRPAAGVLATDIALTMTEFLRARDVVGSFVEFYGEGLDELCVPDRATVANMAPEYGSTVAYFPVDQGTLDYLRLTGRPQAHIALVERYCKEQRLFRPAAADDDLAFSRTYDFDLSAVEVSVAGPSRPHERMPLRSVPRSLRTPSGPARAGSPEADVPDGAIAIAAITSCTNTSNPAGMAAAGLLARRAVERGLHLPPWLKPSLAPGSRTVSAYLDAAGLTDDLAALGFALVGYGCTTCIGNAGDLRPMAAQAAGRGARLVAVMSGNRNFEGRVNAGIVATYLMSPPLVVAYALAGTVLTDLTGEPLGFATSGEPVFLEEIWPAPGEIARALAGVSAGMFRRERSALLAGDELWSALPAPAGATYDWPAGSTYLRPSPFVTPGGFPPPGDLIDARALVFAPDSTTTDHISPAGPIPRRSTAAAYLAERGVGVGELNSYGCRRGNHDVLVRGVFANPMFRNRLTPGHPGAWTARLPGGEVMSLVEAADAYARERIPLIILAGRNYGMGSSRDWAAKGPRLLGVRAVLAVGFERIHRSNLLGVGILPLQFPDGTDAGSLGLSGRERFTIEGTGTLRPGGTVSVSALSDGDGRRIRWPMIVRADSERELGYLRHGGFLPAAAERLLSRSGHATGECQAPGR